MASHIQQSPPWSSSSDTPDQQQFDEQPQQDFAAHRQTAAASQNTSALPCQSGDVSDHNFYIFDINAFLQSMPQVSDPFQSEADMGERTTAAGSWLTIASQILHVTSVTDAFQVTLKDFDGKRCLPCPHRVAEDQLQMSSYTCNGITAGSMAQIRRHLKRNHSIFIKLCQACNIDILDKTQFELFHDKKCRTPGKQQKGAGQEVQWYALYEQIESIVRSAVGIERTTPSILKVFSYSWLTTC